MTDAGEQRLDDNFGAFFRKEPPAVGDGVARVAFAHPHFQGAAIGSGAGECELLAEGPEAQQPDAELPLDAVSFFQVTLQGIANMSGHVGEVGQPVRAARDSVSVVDNLQVGFPASLPRVIVTLPA